MREQNSTPKNRWIAESIRLGWAKNETDAIMQWDEHLERKAELTKHPQKNPNQEHIKARREWIKAREVRYPDLKDLWDIVDGIVNTDTTHPGWFAAGLEVGLDVLQHADRLKRSEISHQQRKLELREYISEAIKRNEWRIFGEIDEMFTFAKSLKPHHMYRVL